MKTRRWVVGVLVPSITAVVGGFVGARLAAADPGGRTRRALTVAGTLTGAGSSAMVTFRFRKGTAVQCAPVVLVVPGAGGVFSAEVPMDQSGQVCPDALFDGSDVQVDVVVGGATVVNGSAVNPVPYARYAEQVGTPDCPVGYQLVNDPSFTGDMRRCSMTRADGAVVDTVVRVGTGPAAFWIDRYEATIWETSDATVGPLNSGADQSLDSHGLPLNGQWRGSRPPLFARSRGIEQLPGRWVSWFQADALCRASGKRLPTGSEWLAAARGTSPTGCQIGVTAPRTMGSASDGTCNSEWGAHDMIGNAAEWNAEWFAAPGVPSTTLTSAAWPDPGFGDDATYNIVSGARTISSNGLGLPATALRGGDFNLGSGAGVYSLQLSESPARSGVASGFRCVIPR